MLSQDMVLGAGSHGITAGLPLAISKGTFTELAYMASALLFILGIKRLSGVKTARRGNQLAAIGMGVAVAVTLFYLFSILDLWIVIVGVVAGSVIGARLAKQVPMTAMPELVAFFNGLGGGASFLVALSAVHAAAGSSAASLADSQGGAWAIAIGLSVLIGGVTLSGSLIAWGKLNGKIRGMSLGPIGSKPVNAGLGGLAILLMLLGGFVLDPGAGATFLHYALLLGALALGVGLVMPIGGADMPVVISLLNSYSGLAASATGFVIGNNLLIIAGSLVGASGLILTKIMCKAMNRSLINVLAGGFGDEAEKDDSGYENVKSTSAEEVAPLLDAASRVIVVPGYGLAVAQAQHKVREMASILQKGGCEVSYAIHPVAGRMPGHMNVLLAEADVPYEQLFDLDQINGEFKNAEVVLIIGANDVCNPAAIDDPKSPIAGMPVLKVWEGQTVINIKRSLSPGYAGIKNPLFERDNSLMLFADAKKALEEIVSELQDL